MNITRASHTAAVAVFDISSSSVGGAHVLVTKKTADPVVMLAQARVDAPIQEDLTMKRFVDEAVHSLEQVALTLKRADTHHPSHIQIALASPWYTSMTRTIVYKKNAPFVCTKKFIDSLIDTEIASVLADEKGTLGAEGRIVEKQLSLVKLNGYSTTNPYGKKVHSVELYLTITIAAKIIIERFTDVLHHAYGVKNVGITTSPFMTYIVVRDHCKAPSECIVVDVGEEMTDVAFIKDTMFLYQHSFPVGTYELYRVLSEKSGCTIFEAKTHIEMYRLGKIANAEAKSVETALASFTKRWQQGLQKILDEGQYGFCLPEWCYISADPRFERIFTDLVQDDPFIQYICSRGAVHPVFITKNTIEGMVNMHAVPEPDVALATAALFVKRLM